MAIENPVLVKGFKAAEDLSNYQYHFVTLEDNKQVRLLDSASERPIGVLQNEPAAGAVAEVMLIGISKLKMNDAVAVGTLLKAEYVDASDNGKGDAADTDGDYCAGMCVYASGAEDDLGSILLSVPLRISVPT